MRPRKENKLTYNPTKQGSGLIDNIIKVVTSDVVKKSAEKLVSKTIDSAISKSGEKIGHLIVEKAAEKFSKKHKNDNPPNIEEDIDINELASRFLSMYSPQHGVIHGAGWKTY